jgi:hypothetical protein
MSASDDDEYFDAVDEVPTETSQNFRGRSHFVEDHIGQHIPFRGGEDAIEEISEVFLDGDDDLLVNSRPLFPVVKKELKKMASRSSEVLARTLELESSKAQRQLDQAKKRSSADSIGLGSQELSAMDSSFLSERLRSTSRVSTIDTITEDADEENPEPVSPHSAKTAHNSPTTATSDVESAKGTPSGSEGGFLGRFRKAIAKPPPPSSDKSDNGDSVASSTEKDSNDSTSVSRRETHAAGGHHLSHNRSLLENMALVQRCKFHDGPIWAVEFSPCGKYLASAGRDTRVVVWSVGIDRRGVADEDIVSLIHVGKQQETSRADLFASFSSDLEEGEEDDGSPSDKAINKMKMIFPEPCRVYRDHMDDVVDLSWTRKSFLLSASVDKTVRLWNIKM